MTTNTKPPESRAREKKRIYPVPEHGGRDEILKPGPWVDGAVKPEFDGQYLRRFDEGDAFSWFRDGVWHTDGFFGGPSDVQNAPYRGGVLRAKRAHEEWERKYGGLYDDQSDE